MEDKIIINLKDYINRRETALVGREHGESLLKLFKESKIVFRDIEKTHKIIYLIIPENIVSINKSYFLGLFETRIQDLGKEAFLEKYVFEANDYIKEKIEKNVNAALLVASQKEILGLDD